MSEHVTLSGSSSLHVIVLGDVFILSVLYREELQVFLEFKNRCQGLFGIPKILVVAVEARNIVVQRERGHVGPCGSNQ